MIQPTRSLLSLFFLVTSTNVASVFFHLLGFAGGTSDMKGIMLDFVGQSESLLARTQWAVELTTSEPGIPHACSPSRSRDLPPPARDINRLLCCQLLANIAEIGHLPI